MPLIDDARQQQQAPAQPQQGQAQPQQGQGGLGPEKDAMVAKGYQLGKNLLYRKKVFDGLMKQLGEGKPAAVMAEAIVFILEKIQADMKMPFDALLATGVSLLGDLTEALNRTGRFQLSGQDVTAATELAINMYLQAHGKEFDQNELMQQYQQGVQQFNQSGGGQPQQGGV